MTPHNTTSRTTGHHNFPLELQLSQCETIARQCSGERRRGHRGHRVKVRLDECLSTSKAGCILHQSPYHFPSDTMMHHWRGVSFWSPRSRHQEPHPSWCGRSPRRSALEVCRKGNTHRLIDRNVHNNTPSTVLLISHVRIEKALKGEHTVDSVLFLVFLDSLLSDRLGNGHAGVRNKDIQFAKVLNNFLDVLLDSLGVRDLDLVSTRKSAESVVLSRPLRLTL
ncbi:hypothetical protein KC364_g31 [Hortaea werneckii]|nr:hypothetical protein KC364_g31 [Hortaea werneckii]